MKFLGGGYKKSRVNLKASSIILGRSIFNSWLVSSMQGFVFTSINHGFIDSSIMKS